ncbi:MAG: hypothetical protein HZB65_01020 [Candidatus Aenigmarchaeota archaeon]|nr:hypothetical protein [Candidatus Aenigmarchaeota archaeon]
MNLKDIVSDFQIIFQKWQAEAFYKDEPVFLRNYRMAMLNNGISLKKADREISAVECFLNEIDATKELLESELRYMEKKGTMPFRCADIRKEFDGLCYTENNIMRTGSYYMLPVLDREYTHLAFNNLSRKPRSNETIASGITTGYAIKAGNTFIDIADQYPGFSDKRYGSSQEKISMKWLLNSAVCVN